VADYEYRTAVKRLRASEEARALLERTLSDWHEACRLATECAWPHTTDARTIQSMAYDAIREQTDLGSQHAILVTKQVASALKTCVDRREKGLPTSKPRFRAPTLTYDARCLSLFDDGTVSLATVEGRVRCDLCLPSDGEGYQHQFLEDEAWSLTESTLSLRDEELRLHLGFRRPLSTEETAGNGAILGVDLGVENIAVTSTARFFSGRELAHVCREHAKRRRSLERVGSRAAHLIVERLGSRERRYIRNRLHEVSRAIVDEASRYDCSIIALENLSSIQCLVSRAEFSHYWAYAALARFVEYKAESEGIEVVFVAPRGTSRTCAECGYCDQSNRRDRATFRCLECGRVRMRITTPRRTSRCERSVAANSRRHGRAPVGVP
jgi:IS605 OrfB family transposase